MAGKLSLEKEREWIAIASRVVAELLKELDLNSCRLAAKRLGVNARTMAKLNPNHPAGEGIKERDLGQDTLPHRGDAQIRASA